ncbi:MAG: chaperone modulator CbpM [Bacteroidetes bacterium]|nr:chaperone modulator CbpM [Bacteroidota bacterium]
MHTENLIALDEFCTSHNIEISFISSLQQTGLIEISTVEDTGFIDNGQLLQLEKLLRFHYDLDINLEGIETITHLLQRIDSLQEEIVSLRNRLRLYESNE